MSHGDLQGWFADPFRLHEQRYFSAGRPTKLVRDGTVEGYDEPPSEMFEPVPPAADGTAAYAAGFWQQAGAISDQAAIGGLGYSGPRGRRRGPGFSTWYMITVVAVAAVVAVVIVAVRHESEVARSAANARDIAFVTHSAQRILADRTAHATISGSVQVAGQSFPISGTGEIDFSTGADAQTLQMTVYRQQLVEKVITTRRHIYYTLILNGTNLVGQLSAGDWLEAPVPVPSSASLTSRDPRAAMLLLEHGDTVRGLGTKRLGGVTCTGYAVTPSRQAMAAAASDEISTLKLSRNEADLLRSIAPPTISVWVDAHGVLHQMSVGVQIGAGASGTVTGTATENLSDYGAPVHIKPPRSRDVISLKTFLQMEANYNGSNSVPWIASSS